MLSFGTFASCALARARRRRAFIAGSPPPSFAATVTSLITLVKTLPLRASEAAFLCLMFAHLECPAMVSRYQCGVLRQRGATRAPPPRRVPTAAEFAERL